MDSHKSYQTAEITPTTLLGSLKFLWTIILIGTKSFFLSIPVFLNWFKDIFVPPKPKNITGQLAVVTGGSAGIGKAIATRLAQEGCNIAIANRNLAEGQKTAEEIAKKFGVKAKAFKVDVSKNEDVKKLKEDVEESMGVVDILVNNAGLLAINLSLLERTPENVQEIIDVNLTSYFWTARHFLPGMIDRKKGHIVAVSSLSAKFSAYGTIAYTATKCGNDGFMRSLYDDLCLEGHDEYIKLSTVYPAFFGTQKQLKSVMNIASPGMPVYDPKLAGELIVKGMLQNRREFIVPAEAGLFLFFRYLPDKVLKWAKLSMIDLSKKEDFMNMKNQ